MAITAGAHDGPVQEQTRLQNVPPTPAVQAPGGAFVGLAHSGVPDDEGWLARLEHASAVSTGKEGKGWGC